MTVKEYLDYLKQPAEKQTDREKLTALLKALTPATKRSLLDQQSELFYKSKYIHPQATANEDFLMFVREQSDLLVKCIELEMSDFGRHVRVVLGLEPLTLEMELGT